jgi:hypothetical protein
MARQNATITATNRMKVVDDIPPPRLHGIHTDRSFCRFLLSYRRGVGRIWWVGLLGTGCGFTPGVVPADAVVDVDTAGACAAPAWDLPYAHRFLLATNAPADYTVTVDVSEALAMSLAGGDDLRVVDDDGELDRVLAAATVDLRVPAASGGAVFIYVGALGAGIPPRDPANVYIAAESFDALPIGDNAAARFDPQPVADWTVVDDGGNHIYRAQGASRHPAALRGLALADADIRARLRIDTGGGQQHDGLAARGNSMAPLTMDGFVTQLQGDSDRQRIAEYANGASPPAELSFSARTIARDTWYAMRLRYVGDAIEMYIDGALVLSATQPGSDGKLVGLFAHDCIADYDDVTVRLAVSPEPSAMLGAREDRCP